jgi:hypothetical protein
MADNFTETQSEESEKPALSSHLITVSLKAHPDLERQVQEYCAKNDMSRAAFARRSFRLYLTHREFWDDVRLTDKLSPQTTENDVNR